MPSSGMLSRVVLVRTDISGEHSASIIRLTRICELGRTLAVTGNRRTLRRNTKSQVITSEKTAFFIVTAVEPSNLNKERELCNCLLYMEGEIES
jgi:hypothetical protein